MKQLFLLLVCMLSLTFSLQAQTWDERPEASYDKEYSQVFNPTAGWNGVIFYDQWNTTQQRIFNAIATMTG